jgi:hypothetical protein
MATHVAYAAAAGILMMAAQPLMAHADDSGTTVTSATVSNPNNCKVVERKPGEAPSGDLSASVTAGGGKVTSHTSGGNGVTVHSGNGQVSSSVSTTGSGGSTTVTTSDGDCVIYVNPGQKQEK